MNNIDLLEKGVKTRYKVGCKGRTTDMVSALTRTRLKKNSFPLKK